MLNSGRLILLLCICVLTIPFISLYAQPAEKAATGQQPATMEKKEEMKATPAQPGAPALPPAPDREPPMPGMGRPMRERPKLTEQELAERQKMYFESSYRRLERMGATPEMIKEGQLMIRFQMYMDGAEALLAQSKELGLTDQQKEELAKIQKEAREKALKLLTEEQRKKLGAVPAEPKSMLQLNKEILKKMSEQSSREEMSMMMLGPILTCFMEEPGTVPSATPAAPPSLNLPGVPGAAGEKKAPTAPSPEGEKK